MNFVSGKFGAGRSYSREILAGSVLLVAVVVALLAGPVPSSGESSPQRVYVIGAGAGHALIAEALPVPTYTRFLSTALGTVNDSMTPVLSKRTTSPTAQKWGLNSIGVGLGVSGQIGLGPIFNMTITPQLRLVFSDSKNPVYPN